MMDNDLYIGWDELLHYDTKLKEYLEGKLLNAGISEETVQRIVQELLAKYVTIEDAQAAKSELVAQIDKILSDVAELDAGKVDESEFETFQTSILESVEKLETDLTVDLENTFKSVSLTISDLKDSTEEEFDKLSKVVADNDAEVNQRLDLVEQSIESAQATAIQKAIEQASAQDAVVLVEAQQYADSLGSNYDTSGAADAVKAELTEIINGKVDKEAGKSLIKTTDIERLENMSDGANKVEPSEVNGNIKIDGTDTTVYKHPDKHTIAEVDGLPDALASLQPKGDYAEKATTLAGYGINDAYTKEEVSNQDAVTLAEAQRYTKELVDALPPQVNYTVEITENTDDEAVAKTYVFTQNGSEIGTIKLPKDLVVTSGTIKTVAQDDVPYTGAKVGDKYIELIIGNQSSPLYIPAKDLVDVYTAKDNATEVQIAISDTNEISATLVNGGVTEEKLAEGVKTKLNKTWEEVGVAKGLVDALAEGQVKTNKEAIEAINDADTGILKQSKSYTDNLLTNYATNEEVANQDAVVLAEAQQYADAQDAAAKDDLIKLIDGKQPAGSYAPAQHTHSVSEITDFESNVAQTLVNESVKASQDGNGDNISETYAKKATTLEGYNITDAYTKTETSNQDAVVLAESEIYTDQRVAELKTTLEGDVDNKLNEVRVLVTNNTDNISTLTETVDKLSAAVANISKLELKRVDSIDDIVEENVIYLVPNENTLEKNVYDEYIIVGYDDAGNTLVEIIGSTGIDLDNYVTNDVYQKHVEDCANSAAEAKQYTDEQVATVQSNVDTINTFTDADGKKYRFRFELAEGQPRIVYEEILTGEDN